jgi:hypothetical protein
MEASPNTRTNSQHNQVVFPLFYNMSDAIPNPNDISPGTDTEASVAKGLGVSESGLNELLDAIEKASPELGGFLRSLLGGPIGITFAAAHAIYSSEKEELDEQNKEMDASAELSAQPLGAGVEAYYKHIQDAKQAMADLQSELVRAGTDTDPIGTRFKLIKMFADTFIEGLKKIAESKGTLEEASLRSQNAAPQQIVALQQKTLNSIAQLDKLKSFFDGSGLLELELAARKSASKQFGSQATNATVANNKAIAANQDFQLRIEKLRNEAGKGQLGPNDPAYVAIQNRISDGENKYYQGLQTETLDMTHAVEEPAFGGHAVEVNEKIKRDNQAIADALTEWNEGQKEQQDILDRLSALQAQQGNFNKLQSETTTQAKQKEDIAKLNLARINELHAEIVFGQFLEQMQQGLDAQAESNKAAADQMNTTASVTNADLGLPSMTADETPSVHGLPLSSLDMPGGFNGDQAGFSHLDQKRLNGVLTSIIASQNAMTNALNQSKKDQDALTERVQVLEKSNRLLTDQIRHLQTTGIH